MRAAPNLGVAARVDAPAAVRGGSAGFTILVLGGLSAPIAAAVAPSLGAVWLTATAIVAFAVAAWRGGRAGIPVSPGAQGAVSAVCAYLLVVPLVLLDPASRDPLQLAATSAVAVGVGAITGIVRAALDRRRTRRN